MKFERALVLYFFLLCAAAGKTQGLRSADYRISGKAIGLLQQPADAVIRPDLQPDRSLFAKEKDAELPRLSEVLLSSPTLLSMPKAWSYQDLGFFCKMEVRMERSAGIPVKVRLGEVQYVEKMEGKYKY